MLNGQYNIYSDKRIQPRNHSLPYVHNNLGPPPPKPSRRFPLANQRYIQLIKRYTWPGSFDLYHNRLVLTKFTPIVISELLYIFKPSAFGKLKTRENFLFFYPCLFTKNSRRIYFKNLFPSPLTRHRRSSGKTCKSGRSLIHFFRPIPRFEFVSE